MEGQGQSSKTKSTDGWTDGRTDGWMDGGMTWLRHRLVADVGTWLRCKTGGFSISSAQSPDERPPQTFSFTEM